MCVGACVGACLCEREREKERERERVRERERERERERARVSVTVKECLGKAALEKLHARLLLCFVQSAAYMEPPLLMQCQGTMCHTIRLQLSNWQQTGESESVISCECVWYQQ